MRPVFKDSVGATSGPARAWRALALIVALFLLNSMVTFHNVWPTLFIRFSGEFSVELAAALLLLAVWQSLRGALPRRLLSVLAVLFVLATIGRYAEVTAPALYGREVNLYWDLPHVTSLAGMLRRVASAWQLLALLIGIVAFLTILYLAARWSLRRIALALQSPPMRMGLSVVASVMIVSFTLQNLASLPRVPPFSMPITKTYADQVAKIRSAISEGETVRELPPSPAFASTLSAIAGSDVMVVFVESYGRVVYDRSDLFDTLAPARADLETAARETGRTIASGYVKSPTFGGQSWLAHLNFLAGVEVQDVGRAQLLMTQARRTFGNALAEHGYRRVAVMPGIKWQWPEGAFYGFDRIYDDPSLGYHGPSFGWWRIPDQFTLARLDQLELAPPAAAANTRKPLFVVFPTVNTHAPFRPLPPYQADWPQILSAQPFDAGALEESFSERPEWSNLSESYQDAVIYDLKTLADYLRIPRRDDLIMIIVGDHQPLAAVAGTNASWDVPVHVITSKPAVLAALKHCGFVPGLVPSPETLGGMHQLGPSLLYAFGPPEHAGGNAAPRCPMGISGAASD